MTSLMHNIQRFLETIRETKDLPEKRQSWMLRLQSSQSIQLPIRIEVSDGSISK